MIWWFPSDTNQQLFRYALELRGVEHKTDRKGRVETDDTPEIRDLAEEYGGQAQ